MPHATSSRRVVRCRVDPTPSRTTGPDTLAVEEPLEIRIGGVPFTVTMRTPGHDLDLALGFLVAEGVVRSADDVTSARLCPDAARDADGRPTHNVVEITTAAGVPAPARDLHRHVTSACGVCGVASVTAVLERSHPGFDPAAPRVEARLLADLPARLRTAQRVFDRTGGLHAAGLFTTRGELLCVREDVGRHNAVDKVVGWALRERGLPLSDTILQVSGRASFELVQKCWAAGCAVLSAVSAPSSLAVDLAAAAGMTLVGFSRGTSFNLYTGADRVPA